MNPLTSYRQRTQLLWGLFLIGVGALYLLDRLDMTDLYTVWQYWPVFVAISGINKLLPGTTSKRIVSGLFEIFFAAWFYVAYQELWGLTLFNSWPLLIIAFGAGMMIEPLLFRRAAPIEETLHEK